jgi:hypothetical protein
MKYLHSKRRKAQRHRDQRRPKGGLTTLGNQGQALFEYLLLLFVSVTLILGLALALFRPLGEFFAQLNNVYIKCLLETGDLPALASEAQAQCPLPNFQARNFDGSAISESQRQQERDKEFQNSSADAGRSGSGEPSSANGRTTTVGPAAVTQSNLLRAAARAGRNARSEAESNKSVTISVETGLGGEGFYQTTSSGGFGRQRKRSRQIALDGLTEYERKKIERNQEKTSSRPIEAESLSLGSRNKKMIVKPPPPKKAQDDLEVETGFGHYFKILIIIIIVAFIIILMGGQALQMTNSDTG